MPDGRFVDSTGDAVFVDTLYQNTPVTSPDTVYLGILLSHPPRSKTSIRITEEDSTGRILTTNHLDSSKSYIFFSKRIGKGLKLMKIIADQFDSSVSHKKVYSSIIDF